MYLRTKCQLSSIIPTSLRGGGGGGGGGKNKPQKNPPTLGLIQKDKTGKR